MLTCLGIVVVSICVLRCTRCMRCTDGQLRNCAWFSMSAPPVV